MNKIRNRNWGIMTGSIDDEKLPWRSIKQTLMIMIIAVKDGFCLQLLFIILEIKNLEETHHTKPDFTSYIIINSRINLLFL